MAGRLVTSHKRPHQSQITTIMTQNSWQTLLSHLYYKSNSVENSKQTTAYINEQLLRLNKRMRANTRGRRFWSLNFTATERKPVVAAAWRPQTGPSMRKSIPSAFKRAKTDGKKRNSRGGEQSECCSRGSSSPPASRAASNSRWSYDRDEPWWNTYNSTSAANKHNRIDLRQLQQYTKSFGCVLSSLENKTTLWNEFATRWAVSFRTHRCWSDRGREQMAAPARDSAWLT